LAGSEERALSPIGIRESGSILINDPEAEKFARLDAGWFVTDGMTPWIRWKNPCLAQVLNVGIGDCSR
jgi:hypothetical protein